MKRLITLLFSCLFALMNVQAQVEKPLPDIHVDGRWLVDTHGNHVVLHGVMDTPNAWFNGGRWGWSYDNDGLNRCLDYFEKMYTALEIANCNIFRLHLDPVWTNDSEFVYPNSSEQPDWVRGEGDIKHFNPNRLKHYMETLYVPLAMKALDHRMYVVMRPPGVCPPNLKVGDYYQKYLMEVWDIVSKNDSVRKYPGQIAIELANEPINLKNKDNENDPKALHDYFQPVVDVIRANGFKGIIWIPGTGFQSQYADYATYPITGENIGYAVHVYPGWYGCDDKKVERDNDIEKSKQDFIAQFKKQVPVVETSPIFVSEVDWSPIKEPKVFDKVNEWGDSIYKNLGTWATASTSKWGVCYKAVLDHYGNISMTLTHPHDYLDLDKMIVDPKHPVPSFDGNHEACSGACWEWYKDYYKKDFPKPNLRGISVGDSASFYVNPIVRADFPDPDVIRVGNTYYMVSTTMFHFPGATIIKSQDLVNWEYCAQPLKALLDNDKYNLKNGENAYAKGMWASSIKYHNGKFYLLINGNDNRAWLLSAANPEGDWEVKRLSRNYYDPGMLFDNGKVYIVCGINHLFMCELDEDFNFVREKEVVVREGSGLEGSHLYKIGDYYYIYATYGGYPSGQVAFRSKNIFGPFEEKVLVEKRYGRYINTIHQGALVEDVSGKWWTVMQEDLGALGRFPNLLPVTWEEGWPVVAGGVRPPVSFVDKVPAPSNQNNQKTLPTSDDFSGRELGMQWQWNHNPVPEAWSLSERSGWLRLKTNDIVQDLHQAQGMLTQRIFADKEKPSSGTIRLDVRKLKEGDRAGICIFQDPYAQLCVERTSKGYQLLWRQDKVRNAGRGFEFAPEEKTQTIKPKKGIVYLKALIQYGESKVRFQYSLDGKNWQAFGGETQQTFNLTVFVGSRFGLFCYATKQQGGYADFDWFSTE